MSFCYCFNFLHLQTYDVIFLSSFAIDIMAQKEPVCKMMVDENKAQHISEVNGEKNLSMFS
jgi:hypothetical protein